MKLERKKLRSFDQTPSREILRTQAQTGISFHKQIKEITDNSVDAGAKNIDITLDIDKNILTVEDDGCGMDATRLENATIAAISNKDVITGQIGRYGIGLKNTAHAIADSFTISTTMAGSLKEHYYEEDLVNMTGWTHPGIYEENLNKSEKEKHGTTTTFYINDKNIINKSKIVEIRKECGDTYERLIKRGDLNIEVNGIKIKPINIEFKNNIFPRKEIIIESGGNKVKTEIGFIELEHWGVHLFNNDRKIVSKIKDTRNYDFTINQITTDRGFYAAIDLDDFEVNNSKTGFILDDKFSGFTSAFRRHPDVKKLLNDVRQYNGKAKPKSTPMNKDSKDQLNDALNKAARIINKRNPLDKYDFKGVVPAILPHPSGIQKNLSQISQNGSKDKKSTLKTKHKNKSSPTTGNYPTVKWNIGGMKMKMVLEDCQLPEEIIKDYTIKEDVYTCFINVDSPVYESAKYNGGIKLFSWNQLAEAVAEHLIKDMKVIFEDAWKMRDDIINLGPECLKLNNKK